MKSFVAGGAVSGVDPDSTGLNPAWRTSLGIVEFGVSWPEGSPASQIFAARKKIVKNIEVIDKVAGPASATYFNEVRHDCDMLDTVLKLSTVRQASLYEKNPSKTFFGSHYDKLSNIKQKYDPSGLLIVAEGVGSEEWDSSLNCRT